MKNKLKKSLSILLSILMLMSITAGLDFSAYADDSGDWSYAITSDTEKTADITGYLGSDTDITIPSTINGYTITRVGNSAFRGYSNLTSVTIPSSVTSIESMAFENCTSLTNVIIPNSVTNIETYTFWGCPSLTTLTIPNSVTTIKMWTFYGCTSLKAIVIPDTLTTIASWAFDSCSNLTDVYYTGSGSDWSKIGIGYDNNYLTDAIIHYNCNPTFDLTGYNNINCRTNTDSIITKASFNSNISKTQFNEFANSLYPNSNYIIPGLKQTNIGNGSVGKYMTPQGMCIAGNYLLISAVDEEEEYCEDHKKTYSSTKKYSVIYVLNKSTKKYITTIVLKTKCHVGGLAYSSDRKEIYVADSSNCRIMIMPYSDLSAYATTGNDANATPYSFENFIDGSKFGNVNPSFVSYFNKRLFIGNCATSSTLNSKMSVYNLETEECVKGISIPLKTQGVAIAEIKKNNKLNQYIFFSTSYGRNNNSSMKIYKIAKNNDFSGFSALSSYDKITFPNMTEDIYITGDYLLTCYEAGSKRYRDDANEIMDRITISSIDGIINKYCPVKSANLNSVKTSSKTSATTRLSPIETEDVPTGYIISGECGEDANFVLYNDGTLNITGQGAMYDYSTTSTPWSEYTDKINSIFIGCGITSVGSNAFDGCTDVKNLEISDLSNYDEEFEIGDSAFSDCTNIESIKMPDLTYSIDSDAFEDTGATVQTDSNSAKEYFESLGETVHTHNYEFVETIAPTCSINGYDLYRCSCGEEKVQNIVDATNEHVEVTIEGTKPTCTTFGKESDVKCEVCGEYIKVGEEIQPTGHSYEITTTAPTCTTQGYTTYTCSTCGDTYIDNYTDALGHNYVNGKCSTCGVVDPNYVAPTQPINQPTTTIAPVATTTPTTTKLVAPIAGATKDSDGEWVSSKVKKPTIKKVKASKKSFKITWKKISGISGYQVQISKSKKFKKKSTYTKKFSKKKTSVKVSGAKGKYYVRMRTYKTVNGTKVYSKWSKVKSVKVK